MNTIVTKIKAAQTQILVAHRMGADIAVVCSFKNVVLPYLARSVVPDIPIISIMTPFTPRETFEHLVETNRRYNFNPTVYMVKEKEERFSKYLIENGIRLITLPRNDFEKEDYEIEKSSGRKLYKKNPKECCRLLKIVPLELAIADLSVWISGLRTPENHREVEVSMHRTKYNPLLNWKEIDIWKYLAINNLPVHPYFAMGYRSWGCACCSELIDDDAPPRSGLWRDTNNCGGDCGAPSVI